MTEQEAGHYSRKFTKLTYIAPRVKIISYEFKTGLEHGISINCLLWLSDTVITTFNATDAEDIYAIAQLRDDYLHEQTLIARFDSLLN